MRAAVHGEHTRTHACVLVIFPPLLPQNWDCVFAFARIMHVCTVHVCTATTWHPRPRSYVARRGGHLGCCALPAAGLPTVRAQSASGSWIFLRIASAIFAWIFCIKRSVLTYLFCNAFCFLQIFQYHYSSPQRQRASIFIRCVCYVRCVVFPFGSSIEKAIDIIRSESRRDHRSGQCRIEGGAVPIGHKCPNHNNGAETPP